MNEIEIVKELFKASSAGDEIVISLNNGTEITGVVESFDGDKISVNNVLYSLSTIVDIRTQKETNLAVANECSTVDNTEAAKYKRKRIRLTLSADESIEGYLFDVRNNKLVIITDNEKKVVEMHEVASIEIAPSEKEEAISAKSEKLNELEEAVLSGDKELVISIVAEKDKLVAFGYSEQDIKQIEVALKMPLPWDDSTNGTYNRARRIYEFQRNKNGIAQEKLLECLRDQGAVSKTKAKALASLIEISKINTGLVTSIYDEFADSICRNTNLSSKYVEALIQNGLYERAREFIKNSVYDGVYEDSLYLLDYYERFADFDFSNLAGYDATDSLVSFKEIRYLMNVPDKMACIQLLKILDKTSRYDAFFTLLDMIMPRAKEDQRIVEVVGSALQKCDKTYLNEYLPVFVTLWFDNTILGRYFEDEALAEMPVNLVSHYEHAKEYADPNEMEMAVIRGDYSLVEVLRSNTSILLSLGYSAEEIQHIKSVEVSSYGNRTAIEKIYELERNKNHIAEVVSGRDYINSPEVVASILFPLLIEAGDGAVLYELYNYSAAIRNKLSSKAIQKCYLQSLVMIGKKDEYWDLIKDTWLSLELDDAMLEKGIEIARELKEDDVASAMQLYKSKPYFNEFETSLIGGEVARIRTIVTDANMLSEMGYDTTEINLIQENLRSRMDLTSDRNLAIANRIYSFQQNKNRRAELFYLLALREEFSLAAAGLISIFEKERRPLELKQLYEKIGESDELIATQYRGAYLSALFEIGDKQKIYNYYCTNGINSLKEITLLEVMLEVNAPESEICEVAGREGIDFEYDTDAVTRVICECIKKDSSQIRGIAIELLAKSLFLLTEDNLNYLKEQVNKLLDSGYEEVSILNSKTVDYVRLEKWIDNAFDKCISVQNRIRLLENIEFYFALDTEEFYVFMSKYTLCLRNQGVEVTEKLAKYLMPRLKNDEDKKAWLNTHLRECECEDANTFEAFCQIATELCDYELLGDYLIKICGQKIAFTSDYVDQVIALLDMSIAEGYSEKKITRLLECAHYYSATKYLSTAQAVILYRAYIVMKDYDYAYISKYALQFGMLSKSIDVEMLSIILNLWNEKYGDKQPVLFEVVKNQLSNSSIEEVDKLITVWGKYLTITDDDAKNLELLNDYYNLPEKWSVESLESLAKCLMCNPSSLANWKLIGAYLADTDRNTTCNIKFHIARAGNTFMHPVLLESSMYDLKQTTVEILRAIVRLKNPIVFGKAILTINHVITRCPEWFADKAAVQSVILDIVENKSLRVKYGIWVSYLKIAIRLAVLSNNASCIKQLLIGEMEENSPVLFRYYLCELLLNAPDEKELIRFSFDAFSNHFNMIPYKDDLENIVARNASGEGDLGDKLFVYILDRSEDVNVKEQDLYRAYAHLKSQGLLREAKDVLKKFASFYPEYSFADDMEKYEILGGPVSDEDVLDIYKKEFASLNGITDPARRKKTIFNMIPGELYLKMKNYEIESVIDLGQKSLSANAVDELKIRLEMYSNLDNVFAKDTCEDAEIIFLKCCFIRKWDEFISYNLSCTYIDEIIKTDVTLKKLLAMKSYDVLKGAVLAIAETDEDNVEIINRADALMGTVGGIRRSKNYLRRIQKLNEEERQLLKRVFGMRLESVTLRSDGTIGAAILNIDGNEKYAYLLGMLEGRSLSEIFNHDECLEALICMPIEKATAISEIYETMFFHGKNNTFSKYLAIKENCSENYTYDDHSSENQEEVCELTRNKYNNLLANYERSNPYKRKNLIKPLALSRTEYLYDAVVNGSESDLLQINPTKLEYLSALTVIFDRKTTAEMKEYIWKLGPDYLRASLSVVLSILEQWHLAYEIANSNTDEEFKKASNQILYLLMKYRRNQKEDVVVAELLKQQDLRSKEYVLRKFYPVNDEQNIVYSDKMKSLRYFLEELLEYMTFNGMDMSEVHFDEDKFDRCLNSYIDSVREDQERESREITNTATVISPIKISDLLDNGYIRQLLALNNEVEAREECRNNPKNIKECISGIKSFMAENIDVQNYYNVLKVKDLIRWAYIKSMDDDGYSRERLNDVLSLISKGDNISKRQWDAILTYLIKYFESVDSLSQLSRIVENDIVNLKNIEKVSNENVKYMRKQDLFAWGNLEEVLVNIAGIDFDRMSESELSERLSECRKKLVANKEDKRTSSFDIITDKLMRLLGEQIISLRSNPDLFMTVLGEDKDNHISISWEHGNNRGYLYAVISNLGGADCRNVELVSKINMTRERTFSINNLYSGERIPFKEVFSAEDLVDGNVTWDIEVSYLDESRNKKISLAHQSVASVAVGGERLKFGNISTGNPAKGDEFIGRNRELAMLRNRYSDINQIPSLLIRGLKRSGKSSIIIQLTEELKKKNKFIVARVDGQSIGTDIRNAFVNKVLDNIRLSYRNISEYKEIISGQFEEFRRMWTEKMNSSDWIGMLDEFYSELSYLFDKKVVIFIDEMEAIFYNRRFESIEQEQNLYASLRALIQNPDNYISFVFCGSDTLLTSCLEQRSESQMFQTLQYLEVGHMTIGDIQEIYRKQSEKYDIKFTSDAVDTIWQYTNGLVWYAKLLGYLVINNILEYDLTIRSEVNRSDITTAVQMLINGEIGTDKYDLVDASLSTPRTAIVHAMASVMPDNNKEVSVDEIATALLFMKGEGYINPRNGESIPELNEMDIKKHLDFLEKMQLVDSNASKTKYQFTAELYRLFFRDEKKLHVFEERSI